MRTFIASVDIQPSGITVNVIENQLTSPLTIEKVEGQEIYFVCCEGAFLDGLVAASFSPMGEEVDAGPQQFIFIGRFNDDKLAITFGNGEEPQAPNASPYFLEVHIP